MIDQELLKTIRSFTVCIAVVGSVWLVVHSVRELVQYGIVVQVVDTRRSP